MSKERELLRRISSHSGSVIPSHFIYEIRELLAQPEPEPEPFKPDWANYRQGVEDATRKPLSDGELPTNNPKINTYGERLAFHTGIRWAEKQHGITGVDDE